MRVSSSLSLLACIIGFFTLLMPVLYTKTGYAQTWIDIQQSPPLWIFIGATLIVAAHDINWLEGIKFIRRSDIRVFRILLLVIAIGLSYTMELAVNVKLTSQTFWQSAIYFDIPNETKILMDYSILYYNIQIVQVFDITFKSMTVYSVFSPTTYFFVFQSFAGLGYHLMRACRLILLCAFLASFLEKSLRISRIVKDVNPEEIKKTNLHENSF